MSIVLLFVLVIGFFLDILITHQNICAMNYNPLESTARAIEYWFYTISSKAHDYYEWLLDLPWARIAGVCSIAILLFIIFIAPRFVCKEHVDKNDEEGSESWPLPHDTISLSYTSYVS